MLLFSMVDEPALRAQLGCFGLTLHSLEAGALIPGSYWGESEAGLIGATLYARADTPLHSVLHEAAHFMCMPEARRTALHTDAGGDFAEENAVCYLQILLAGMLPGVGAECMCRDMDAWGYTFRLGSAGAWFSGDADDTREWLVEHGLIDLKSQLTYVRR